MAIHINYSPYKIDVSTHAHCFREREKNRREFFFSSSIRQIDTHLPTKNKNVFLLTPDSFLWPASAAFLSPSSEEEEEDEEEEEESFLFCSGGISYLGESMLIV